MKTVKEKIAYLRGMLDANADGLKGEQTLAVLQRVMTILDDLADQVDEVEDYVEALDSDLADLEEEYFHDDDCSCADDHDEFDDLEMVEMECPSCQEVVCFDEEFLYDDNVEVTCPECGGTVYTSIDIDELEEDEVSE